MNFRNYPVAAKIPPISDADRERLRQSWQYRVLMKAEGAERLSGGDDKMLRILTAALGLPTKEPPWFGPSAIILEDGLIVANYVDAAQVNHGPTAVCQAQELVDNLQRLADAARLTENERMQLFAKVRTWIKADNRPDAVNMKHDRLPGVTD